MIVVAAVPPFVGQHVARNRALPSSCSPTPLPCHHAPESIDHIDEKNQAIKQLEDELHVRGVGGVEERADAPRAGTERGAPRIRQGASQRQEGYRDEGEKRVVAREPVSVETRRDGGEGEEDGRSARRRTLPQASPHALSSGKQILDGLSRLRSELQGVTTQASTRKRLLKVAD